MIPIVLVTGFLGSGKTSFLKNIVKKNLSRRFVYLVNEFSPRDIDSELLRDDKTNTISIPGGSIFCKCLVSDFIRQLEEIYTMYPDAECLLIEASGMANPKVIYRMLEETGLDKKYKIYLIISIIDPNSFFKLRFTLPNIIAQIESSDIVIINKCDLCQQEKIKEAESEIARLNPSCGIIKTVRADTQIEFIPVKKSQIKEGEYAECKDPNYATFSTKYHFTLNELMSITNTYKDSIFRIKGWINGRYFDYSGFVWQSEEAKDKDENALVWIVKGHDAEKIKNSLRKKFNCSFYDE